MRLLVVRHGESEWNAAGRWAGQRDPGLTPIGVEQARAAARDALRGLDLRAVVSSPLRRARHTAEIIADELSLPLRDPVADLCERGAGEWSGLTAAEIERSYPRLLEAHRTGESVEIPGGEPWPAFQDRVVRAIRELLRASRERLLVVSHGGVLRAVEAHLGESPSRWSNLGGRWLTTDGDGLRGGPPHST